MKTRLHPRLLRAVLVLALLISSLQCTTLHYSGVQNSFEKAASAENTGAESPFVDSYETVRITLTDSYILRLDPRLRPNAWVLRALSEWRSGHFEPARRSAAKGLAAQPAPGSRDEIVLSMIDSMTLMTDLERQATATGDAGIPPQEYEEKYQPGFKEAWASLAGVERKFNAATPGAAKDYWNFQRWRFTIAWREAISRISDNNAAERAQRQAEASVGMPLRDAGDTAKARINPDSPFKNRKN